MLFFGLSFGLSLLLSLLHIEGYEKNQERCYCHHVNDLDTEVLIQVPQAN